jgi:hypothetical protein
LKTERGVEFLLALSAKISEFALLLGARALVIQGLAAVLLHVQLQ